ncbi:16S rRNA (guanine(527)-N(7))-methyltransferase RsmG [Marinicella gelatinilytica]|uniref:16S rRNA (guanine(527)-N(7))-methyltransferase RsmG n=1 Tax=Marinicella gelatinilytica TaxID=2996017 RepID=UPI0022608DE3|nr:16S rRNA (guanine(527)-N(7))-methyltransferase RsmG [Marinicella gelatinilytica]MCX7544211.1 16S rRNA (guanine(527)-N(7))-methyltransferase RsmG [Marinicella gelatinilytica]
MNEANSQESAKQLLQSGLEQLDLDVEKCPSIMHFLALLQRWNNTYKMTAITDWHNMVVQHALDSAAVIPYVEGVHIIDVGTGGGLPGIMLALFKPESSITLIDAVAKKTRFLNHVKRSLALQNIHIVHDRVENFIPDKKFDVVISRAFAEVNRFLSLTQHLGDHHSRFMAMKGPKEEPLVVDSEFNLVSTLNIEVPFLDAQRKLYQYMKKSQ